ncbi:hypothetical protein CBR_g19859 [Chara braunii]|uniref:Reverse transcriptase domain-containing protein n=1 Tax=Chara braunii TaxID=69332 RepID=A0A388KZ44_CHABU|nr:hypothetical protein CBR_g19859 [Chara braunii]|eukprot:GBG75223.1 hypothetical protein CBR_g19859 [Chara braunii]
MNMAFQNFVRKTRLAQSIINYCVIVYVDDILVYSSSYEGHVSHIEWALHVLRDAGFKVAFEKCQFFLTTISFLGHVVTDKGLQPEPQKVAAVRDAPVPTTITQVRAFLGLASYYRRFIKGFATIAGPLINLLRKDQPLIWTLECDQAFSKLKAALISGPVLIRLDPEKPFVLITDWQPEAISAILVQVGPSGLESVVEYASKSVLACKRNYAAPTGECYAALWGISHFRAYLYGRKFTLVTDHEPLLAPNPTIAASTKRLEREVRTPMLRYERGDPYGTFDRAWMWGGRYGVTLPKIRGEGEVAAEFFEIYEQETVIRFSVASDGDSCIRKAEIFLSPDARLVFATELAEGKDPLGIVERALERLGRLRGRGARSTTIDKVEYRGRAEVPRAGHGRTWNIPTWAYRLLYANNETVRRVLLRGQVIEKFPLGEEGGHELFTQCWESREDNDFEWWALVGEFIKPLFSGQPGDVDKDFIRRCAQEGVRGVSDLEVANLALTASEEKRLRDSWWIVTTEQSEGEDADEDSGEKEEGTEEEKSSRSNRDSGEEGEPGSDTDGSEGGD